MPEARVPVTVHLLERDYDFIVPLTVELGDDGTITLEQTQSAERVYAENGSADG